MVAHTTRSVIVFLMEWEYVIAMDRGGVIYVPGLFDDTDAYENLLLLPMNVLQIMRKC